MNKFNKLYLNYQHDIHKNNDIISHSTAIPITDNDMEIAYKMFKQKYLEGHLTEKQAFKETLIQFFKNHEE